MVVFKYFFDKVKLQLLVLVFVVSVTKTRMVS